MSVYWNEDVAKLVDAVLPVIPQEWWDRKHDVFNYVNRCEMLGFAGTDELRRQCATRYMAGKRKVSAPGAKRRKDQAKKLNRLIANTPQKLVEAVEAACQTKMAKSVENKNSKAMNALVGMVLSKYKAEPAAVRYLIAQRLFSEGADV